MNRERLLQLADHLENGKLGHKIFDFIKFNDTTESMCGTAGCAIGECPILWPDDWEWSNHGLPMLPPYYYSAAASAIEWFDIDHPAYKHLFTPYQQNPLMFGGEMLSGDATRYEVAAGIRAFLVKMKGL